MAWAIEMRTKPEEFWRSVIFSDESRYCQFSHNGRTWVWRRSSQQLDDKFLHQTVKYGGVNIMVWGAIWYGGRSQLKDYYRYSTTPFYLKKMPLLWRMEHPATKQEQQPHGKRNRGFGFYHGQANHQT
ncbi:hypothetical protein Trydic_g702 [Trypoxylus dichotomus]